jgi:hypothetical protein
MDLEDGMFSWADLMVQIAWFDPLKIKFIEHLGPSLRVTQLGTKRNDHAPEGECDNFLNICPKLAILRKSNQV